MNGRYHSKFLIIFISIILTSCSVPKDMNSFNAKFEPPNNKVLVFVGQDNKSIGGNSKYRNGYIDNIGTPAGITHYIGIDNTDSLGNVKGLNIESNWGAGPMCLKYYLESPKLSKIIIHLSISMTNDLSGVANGKYDKQINELMITLKKYSHRPFMLRIGYEFDGSWNNYDSTNFKLAYRRIVDKLKQSKINNFATVMASSSFTVPKELWEAYYPGDTYVDWLGYSYWGGNPSTDSLDAFVFARKKNKPIFIAEIAPRAHYIKNLKRGKKLWDTWFNNLFNHIDDNRNYIKAISYINCDWDLQEMWDGWGDSRIQANKFIKDSWTRKINESLFINADDEPFKQINFR